MKKRKAMLKGVILASALGFASGASAGPTLWIDDSQGNLGTVDATTGSVNYIGNMGTVMTDIAFDPTGNLFGISSSALYGINKSTGAATMVGSFGAAAAMSSTTINSLVFSSTGTLYAAGTGLFTLNPSTGAATFLGFGSGQFSFQSAGDLAFAGGNLYLTGNYSGFDKLYVVNPSNVSSSYWAGYPGAGYITDGSTYYSNVMGLASPDNVHLYGVDGSTILGINPTNGFATVLATYSSTQGLGSAYGAAFYSEAGATVAAVPEPETYAMMLAGLGLLGFMARRRKQKEAAAA